MDNKDILNSLGMKFNLACGCPVHKAVQQAYEKQKGHRIALEEVLYAHRHIQVHIRSAQPPEVLGQGE